MLELWQMEQIPLVDTHVHRVHPGRAPDFSHLGGGYIEGPGQAENGRQTLLYGMVLEALRAQIGLPQDMPLREVEAVRHGLYAKNPAAYYKQLIENQNVRMYCLETGSPIGGAAYTADEVAYFNASIPEEKRCEIVRIDRVMDDILGGKLPFEAFVAAFDAALRHEIEEHKTVGLKSCAAYNGGLAVEIVPAPQAKAAYETIRKGEAGAREKKLVHNYILLHSTDLAAEYGLPLQMHTGSGGGNYLHYQTQSPAHLAGFLQHKRVKNRVKVVLLHGGHPHEEDTSYLVAQFSNVYTDFSGAFYLSSLKGVERMAALLERTPLNKVMYGSDGIMFPEVSWFAHGHFRRQLVKLLNGMVDGGYLTENRAMQVASMFMQDNAFGCYTKLNEYSKP